MKNSKRWQHLYKSSDEITKIDLNGASAICVLPFKVSFQKTGSLQLSPDPNQDKFFAQLKPQDLPAAASRFKYFAEDIAEQLYGRSEWYEWRAEPPASFCLTDVENAELSALVQVQRPRIVVFEGRNTDLSASPSLGFLIIEFRLGSNAVPPGFSASTPLEITAAWLRFVEGVRHWQRPFGNFEWPKRAVWKTPNEPLKNDMPGQNGFEQWESWLKQPLRRADGTGWALFPSAWFDTAQRFANIVPDVVPTEPPAWSAKSWIAYTDHRCFVWSTLVSESGATKHGDVLLQSAFWAKFVNVDGVWSSADLLTSATAFENQWLAPRTYQRWLHFGSAYGFTFHSGVAWLPPSNNPPLAEHFQTIYFDMALLLLYVRTSLFDYSVRVSRLSTASQSSTGNQKTLEDAWLKSYTELRRSYQQFTNLYQFPLIANQQQGIEIYAILREQMDINEMHADIDKDINAGQDYFKIVLERQQAKSTLQLQQVATWFLPVSVAAGALALSNREEKLEDLQKKNSAKEVGDVGAAATIQKPCFIFQEDCFQTDWLLFIQFFAIVVFVYVFRWLVRWLCSSKFTSGVSTRN